MVGRATGLIAIDWGTTSMRAALLDSSGAPLDIRRDGPGISRIPAGEFQTALLDMIGPWLGNGTPPVVASGMVGSRNGWVEVPYVPCPAGLDALASGARRLDTKGGLTLHVLPGVSVFDAEGVPDVMRGEEVQILGLDNSDAAAVVLPGTHSKWATVDGGRITSFRTFMTGELFAAVMDHTIIGRLAGARDPDPDAFARGVRRGHADPALSHGLFTARTLALFGELSADAVASYVSGLLIGAEFAANPGDDPITVIADDRLSALYAQAAGLVGRPARRGDGDAAFQGIWRIAAALHLTGA